MTIHRHLASMVRTLNTRTPSTAAHGDRCTEKTGAVTGGHRQPARMPLAAPSVLPAPAHRRHHDSCQAQMGVQALGSVSGYRAKSIFRLPRPPWCCGAMHRGPSRQICTLPTRKRGEPLLLVVATLQEKYSCSQCCRGKRRDLGVGWSPLLAASVGWTLCERFPATSSQSNAIHPRSNPIQSGPSLFESELFILFRFISPCFALLHYSTLFHSGPLFHLIYLLCTFSQPSYAAAPNNQQPTHRPTAK